MNRTYGPQKERKKWHKERIGKRRLDTSSLCQAQYNRLGSFDKDLLTRIFCCLINARKKTFTFEGCRLEYRVPRLQVSFRIRLILQLLVFLDILGRTPLWVDTYMLRVYGDQKG